MKDNELKNRIKSAFYEKDKKPSHKNYIAILAAIAAVIAVIYAIQSGMISFSTETGGTALSQNIATDSDADAAAGQLNTELQDALGDIDELGTGM